MDKPMKRDRAIRLAKRELRHCATAYHEALQAVDFDDPVQLKALLEGPEAKLYQAARELVAAEALPTEDKP